MMSKTVHLISQFPSLFGLTVEALPDFRVIDVKLTRKTGLEFDFNYKLGQDEMDQLREAEVVFGDCNLLAQTFHRLPKVKWYQATWAGIDLVHKHFRETGDSPPDCPFARFSGPSFGQSMFDYCFAHLMMTERRFFRDYEASKLNKKFEWQGIFDYKSSDQMTVAILGATGAIGTHLAKRFRQLGSTVFGYGRKEKVGSEVDIDKYSNRLEDILPECDCLICVLPDTPESRGLLNNDVLRLCAKRPVLINVGRGSVIAESEIIRALDNQWISDAILDVFEVEPLPTSSPLWSHPKVLVTPHCSANCRLRDCVQLFADNYKRFTANQGLLYAVNWDDGY